ncbi:GntR family transcriptional regulator [Caballeronia sp. SEWSISQ10-4 2]|uniref:GntR family transcriptional regulator n=1 Tax=Caballeronia sp. SEWSISQ10-4 2 TaxID=2937438 RepID=UPI002650CFA7|nr:GntR family transcriptional regulator [Caballeronia sp. SEWSISQ10-4 2]MDN7179388.1 GntR family transcriptional regulator [Caballeronia sp. SEWSISQ10-4 2]
MTLIRENVTSLYEQIAETLREEIELGSYEPSGKLPSEAELSERFDVSRVTVRLAIGKLAAEKLVDRKQGKGTFATAKRLQHRLDVLRGFYDSLARQGVEPHMALLRMQERDTPAALRGVFGPDVRTCVYIERLHSVGGEPVALAQTYLLPEARTVSREQVANTPSYEILESLPGWHIERADMSISAAAASADIARCLAVSKHAPLLVMKRTTYLTNGRACESTVFHIRPERYEFIVSNPMSAMLVAGNR